MKRVDFPTNGPGHGVEGCPMKEVPEDPRKLPRGRQRCHGLIHLSPTRRDDCDQFFDPRALPAGVQHGDFHARVRPGHRRLLDGRDARGTSAAPGRMGVDDLASAGGYHRREAAEYKWVTGRPHNGRFRPHLRPPPSSRLQPGVVPEAQTSHGLVRTPAIVSARSTGSRPGSSTGRAGFRYSIWCIVWTNAEIPFPVFAEASTIGLPSRNVPATRATTSSLTRASRDGSSTRSILLST